jgi:hypothetical protein
MMDNNKFLAQHLPFNMIKAKKIIDLWNSIFKIKYFDFRHLVSKISKNNWENFDGVVTNVEELMAVLEREEECYIAFSDDDDWYNPALKKYINHLSDFTDVLQWQSLAWFTSITEPGMEFEKPFFDLTQKRRFYTNNWIIKNSVLYKLHELKTFINAIPANLNITACRLLDNMSSTVVQDEIFGMVNKNLGSLSSLLHIKDKEHLLKITKNIRKKFDIPFNYHWAKEEITNMLNLYGNL